MAIARRPWRCIRSSNGSRTSRLRKKLPHTAELILPALDAIAVQRFPQGFTQGQDRLPGDNASQLRSVDTHAEHFAQTLQLFRTQEGQTPLISSVKSQNPSARRRDRPRQYGRAHAARAPPPNRRVQTGNAP